MQKLAEHKRTGQQRSLFISFPFALDRTEPKLGDIIIYSHNNNIMKQNTNNLHLNVHEKCAKNAPILTKTQHYDTESKKWLQNQEQKNTRIN